ncbi:GntR family transcriptional regulator [Rothia koreensis]|uniref:GntR family transcriptional regulator n=1 Tax=Rothia koreensis TaxID=592378 RepID=UPI003F25F654
MVHKHEQVRSELRELARRELSPGAALPGERALEKQFGVSRITIRRAVADLVAEGVLVRIHGKGTFVSHGRVRSTLHLASFTEDMKRAGFEPSTEILVADRGAPPPRAAEFFGLEDGEQTLCVKRLRRANEAPVSVDESWIRPDLTDLLLAKDLTQSLYSHLSGTGFEVSTAEQTVEAAAAEPEVARVLEVEPSAPVLLFHRYTFARSEEGPVPLEYSISTYRSDRYQISMTLDRERLGIPEPEDSKPA